VRIVERAVWEAVERTVEVSLINCGSSQIATIVMEVEITVWRSAKTLIRRVGESTHEGSQIEQDDLVIPSPLVIDPHAPLRIIRRIPSLNSVSPTTRRVPMNDDGRPTFLLQHVVPCVPHAVRIPLGDIDNVVPDVRC
jgi:hypothetical protein